MGLIQVGCTASRRSAGWMLLTWQPACARTAAAYWLNEYLMNGVLLLKRLPPRS
ncbi:hypothetical protein X772_31840 [Mesorhizobium sp. LSJC280B00]|nr:hypothetical protein X772_31840 [Mesorhizobium sp. LSJC280B00]